ncbi:hypothetical protein D3C72_2178770 [compost metagenome]
MWLFIKGVARRHHMLFFADGKFELPGQHVSQLFVRVIVHRTDSALFKINLNRHNFSVMRQNAARDAIAQIVKRCLFMESKHFYVLLSSETLF